MLTSNFENWPAAGHIFPVTAIDLRVIEGPHPYEIAEREQVAENWALEVARNPALFNGKMLLQRAVTIDDGAICGEAHVIDYATFLLWRRTWQVEWALHLFSLPVILSSDGAVIAVRMSQHTANPGRVYCAAGSLDNHDIRDGRCDLEGNMRREVREETGLDLDVATMETDFHALHDRGVITLFRLYRFAETADDLIAAIERHIASEEQSEVDAALAIRPGEPAAYDYPSFMPKILDWILARGG